MLYVSTRNDRDACTYMHTLREDRSPEGGLFLPFKEPVWTEEYLQSLSGMPFPERIAQVLNQLFQVRLTGWDVAFAIGRNPVRLQMLNHRVILAETWHNLEGCYASLEKKLHRMLTSEEKMTDWCAIAIRIAVLAATWAELRNMGISSADLSVVSGDFSLPMSAWYARQWGIPVGDIVCCSNENNNLWNLLVHGQFRTDMIGQRSDVPDSEITMPRDLERLIYACGGMAEVERYLQALHSGQMYFPADTVLKRLRQGMYASVVGNSRVENTIPNVYSTHQYIMTPTAALAYAGLQDYRAKRSRTGYAVIFMDQSPVLAGEAVADALGITEAELKKMF